MRFSTALAAFVVMVAAGSAVQAEPVTLSTWLQQPAFSERFNALFGQTPRPDWLTGATESEAVAVAMDGKPYQVLLACKKHDCGNHQLAVLFDAEAIHGLRFETADNSAQETLTWLNIGGGPESIDGKTILYAAITGSLFNHPKAFAFSAKE